MSFICDYCKKPTENGVSCHKVVEKTRDKVYILNSSDKNGFVNTKKTMGTEIVKESKLCPNCYLERRKRNGE